MVQNIYNTSVRKRFLVIKLIIIIHIPRLHSPEALFFYLQKTYFYCCFTRSKVAFLIALCLFLLLSARINEKEMTKDCKYNFRINELRTNEPLDISILRLLTLDYQYASDQISWYWWRFPWLSSTEMSSASPCSRCAVSCGCWVI